MHADLSHSVLVGRSWGQQPENQRDHMGPAGRQM